MSSTDKNAAPSKPAWLVEAEQKGYIGDIAEPDGDKHSVTAATEAYDAEKARLRALDQHRDQQ